MADEPKPKPKPKPPTPTRFGAPEKTNWLRVTLFTLFVILGIFGIAWMIINNPRQHSLNCQTYNGSGLWSAFGRCQEEE